MKTCIVHSENYNNRGPMMPLISRKENECLHKQYEHYSCLSRYVTTNRCLTDIQHAFGIIVIVIIIIIGHISMKETTTFAFAVIFVHAIYDEF